MLFSCIYLAIPPNPSLVKGILRYIFGPHGHAFCQVDSGHLAGRHSERGIGSHNWRPWCIVRRWSSLWGGNAGVEFNFRPERFQICHWVRLVARGACRLISVARETAKRLWRRWPWNDEGNLGTDGTCLNGHKLNSVKAEVEILWLLCVDFGSGNGLVLAQQAPSHYLNQS